VAEPGPALNPIEQFALTKHLSITVGHYDVSITTSTIFMAIIAAVTLWLMSMTAKGTPGVPGRMQSLGEMAYEFVEGMVRSAAGEEAMKFFPLVFTIFMFVTLANLIGFFPFSFTVTSHIIVTVLLALVVFFTVVIYGISQHGLHFFKLFSPSGVPWYIKPLVIPIEIISFFTRPVSHSVRLFANMLGGHIMVNVIGGFVVMLLAASAAFKVLAIAPFLLVIGLEALELLVALLQAYVFAMLTCMYLNDALHPGH